MNDDSRLQQDVLVEIGREPGLQVCRIGVEVDAGVVTLQGRVDSALQRWNAEGAALRVAGMVALVINIRVQQPPPTPRADADIAQAAVKLLGWLARLAPGDVTVRVDKGWVTLLGQLDCNYQRQAATEAVQDLQGVAGVHNRIALRPRFSPTAVKDDIEAALARQAVATGHRLRVLVDGGDVTLSGCVASRGEHDQALQSARCMPGVRRVLDRITVSPNPLQLATGWGRRAALCYRVFRAPLLDRANRPMTIR